MVDSRRPLVVLHSRVGDQIATRIIVAGPIELDSPGIIFAVEEFYTA